MPFQTEGMDCVNAGLEESASSLFQNLGANFFFSASFRGHKHEIFSMTIIDRDTKVAIIPFSKNCTTYENIIWRVNINFYFSLFRIIEK